MRIAFFRFAVLLLPAVAACNPIYYSPNTQNVPLLLEKGEGIGSAATDGSRFEAEGAYALSDGIGVQVNAGVYRPDDLDNGDGGSGHFFEGGIGYFAPLQDGIQWEVYGLLGTGSFENHFPSTVNGNPGTTGDISGSLLRYGLQPAVGYRTGRFEAAVSSRLVGLSYSGVEGSLIVDSEDQVAMLEEGGTYFLVEPALTLRAGFDRFKVQLQIGGSFNLTDGEFPQDDSMTSIGVVMRVP